MPVPALNKKMEAEKRSVTYNNKQITYYLTRKRVKNINLHIRANDGTVQVSASKYVNTGITDNFVIDNGAFILRALDNYQKEQSKKSRITLNAITDGSRVLIFGKELTVKFCYDNIKKVDLNEEYIIIHSFDNHSKTYDDWLNETRISVYTQAIDKYLPLFINFCSCRPQLIIKHSVSKWGYCNIAKNVIMLNKQLISTPLPLIEYVALHELTHLIYQDHSPSFWKAMEMVMPDCRRRRRALKDYSFLL